MKMLTQAEWDELHAHKSEAERLAALINTPELLDFDRGAHLEGIHQLEIWEAEHDDGKSPQEFYWLLCHLATRSLDHHKEAERLTELVSPTGPNLWDQSALDALHRQIDHHRKKAVHHVVTADAALRKWHARIVGHISGFRPGVATPEPFKAATAGDIITLPVVDTMPKAAA